MGKMQTKGTATEAAIKKATEMVRRMAYAIKKEIPQIDWHGHRVIRVKPKTVKIGDETIEVRPNGGNPHAVIVSPRGEAYVWREKEKKKRAPKKQRGRK